MELIKSSKPLEFKYQDVTFFIRPYATAKDKADLLGEGDLSDTKITMKKSTLMKLLINNFVTGWEGVTEDGKEVPYSFNLFMERFPNSPNDSVIISLGYFILQNSGILKPEAIEKNGLRRPLNGHSEQQETTTHSTVSVKIAESK